MPKKDDIFLSHCHLLASINFRFDREHFTYQEQNNEVLYVVNILGIGGW